ncbi:MAG: hypothetical protein ACI92E_000321 [Oceanicoccus sp.]|jgi:hypothetical protein
MSERQFEYGPIVKGIYLAFIPLTMLVVMLATQWTAYYILVLLFLGFGLRPLLEKTGIYQNYFALTDIVHDKIYHKKYEKKRQEVDRKNHNEKYRKARTRDPSLPKHW